MTEDVWKIKRSVRSCCISITLGKLTECRERMAGPAERVGVAGAAVVAEGVAATAEAAVQEGAVAFTFQPRPFLLSRASRQTVAFP